MHTVKEQVEYLREFVTDYKNDLFRRLIAERTSYVTMVLEDFYQQHNCSAVLRSCDCFGIQNVHVIENTILSRIIPKFRWELPLVDGSSAPEERE